MPDDTGSANEPNTNADAPLDPAATGAPLNDTPVDAPSVDATSGPVDAPVTDTEPSLDVSEPATTEEVPAADTGTVTDGEEAVAPGSTDQPQDAPASDDIPADPAV